MKILQSQAKKFSHKYQPVSTGGEREEGCSLSEGLSHAYVSRQDTTHPIGDSLFVFQYYALRCVWSQYAHTPDTADEHTLMTFIYTAHQGLGENIFHHVHAVLFTLLTNGVSTLVVPRVSTNTGRKPSDAFLRLALTGCCVGC